MPIPTKDTIYIDIDDEITGIINKMQNSDSSVVSLVLPKRASVLQSIVNMRLLKRAADENKKSVVLITSEAGLLPLAGAAGVKVAKTLDSSPIVPSAPDSDDKEETIDEDSTEVRDTEITAATAGAIAVGALAGLPPKDEVETLELDDDDDVATDSSDGTGHVDLKPVVVKKNAKLKVPNFNKFRLSLFVIGTFFVLLIGGFIYANNVLPKAVITIKTDAVSINASINTTLSSTATKVDLETSTIPSKIVSEPKTYTQQATSSGKKNLSTDRATGKVKLINCSAGLPVTVRAGTGVSAKGYTYTLKTDAVMPVGSALCTDIPGSTSVVVDVSALNVGTEYNSSVNSVNSGTTMATAGYSSSSLKSTTTTSMTGGTDNIVTVLSQSDVDGATAKIVTDNPTVKTDLATMLTKAGYVPIVSTLNASAPVVTSTANVGDQVANVTVTNVITYTMYGAKEADLKALVDNNISSQIDTAKQSILSEGLSAATYTFQNRTDTVAQVTLETSATVGPQLNATLIHKQVLGKKVGDVKSLLAGSPGVTSVDIKLSPFWVTSVPKGSSKVTIVIAKPTNTITNTNAVTNP